MVIVDTAKIDTTQRDTLESAFKTFDRDGSGRLSVDEFRDLLLRDTGMGESALTAAMADMCVSRDEGTVRFIFSRDRNVRIRPK